MILANLNGQIEIKTDHGTVTSTQSFTYVSTTNTPQVNGTVVPPGSSPQTQTFNIPFTITYSDSSVLVGNNTNYYNILKSNNRYAVFEIVDPTFTPSKVVSVVTYNTFDNPIPTDFEEISNVKVCNVNNKASGTYYFVLTYTPNGPGTQPILRIVSDVWTQ